MLLPLAASDPAAAFENRITPKRNSPSDAQPYEGVGEGPTADGKLAKCSGAPNCFSSFAKGKNLYYPPWQYTGKSKAEAFADIEAVIKAYKPGQSGIDGGGFKIAKRTDNYVWVQFESAENAYIDDLEITLTEDGRAAVRSGSREGYLDFAVNARRINALAKALGERPGWTTTQITKATNLAYFIKNMS